jgi:hypothetical protein
LSSLNAGFRNFLFASTSTPLVSNDGKGATNVLMPIRVGTETKKVEGQPDAASQPKTPESPAQSKSTTTTTTEPAKALKPEPEPKKENTEMKQEKQTAPQNTVTTTEPATPTALERAQAAYETAKAFFRDGQNSLTEMATALRDAVREDKQRKTDTDGIRAMLQKLQNVKI